MNAKRNIRRSGRDRRRGAEVLEAALVLPIVLLLVDLPPWALGALLIWLAVLAEQMARMFFTGYLL